MAPLPQTTATPAEQNSQTGLPGMKRGIGIGVASCVCVILIALVAFFAVRRRKKIKAQEQQQQLQANGEKQMPPGGQHWEIAPPPPPPVEADAATIYEMDGGIPELPTKMNTPELDAGLEQAVFEKYVDDAFSPKVDWKDRLIAESVGHTPSTRQLSVLNLSPLETSPLGNVEQLGVSPLGISPLEETYYPNRARSPKHWV